MTHHDIRHRLFASYTYNTLQWLSTPDAPTAFPGPGHCDSSGRYTTAGDVRRARPPLPDHGRHACGRLACASSHPVFPRRSSSSSRDISDSSRRLCSFVVFSSVRCDYSRVSYVSSLPSLRIHRIALAAGRYLHSDTRLCPPSIASRIPFSPLNLDHHCPRLSPLSHFT